jgi:hypothetical protein
MLRQASELLNALLNMFRNMTEKAKSYKSKNRNRRRVRVGSDSEHVVRYEDNLYSTPGPISA